MNVINIMQEIGEVLSNTLSLDDEEAVQKELLALQEDIVGIAGKLLQSRAYSCFCRLLKRRQPLNCPLFLLILP